MPAEEQRKKRMKNKTLPQRKRGNHIHMYVIEVLEEEGKDKAEKKKRK